MGTILDNKYVHPEFTEYPRKQENFEDPVSGKLHKTPSYYGRKRKFLNDVHCHTEFLYNPDLSVHRQKSSYHPFEKSTMKLDRCPNQRVIKQMVHGKFVELVVPCGKCAFCLHKRQNELILRCRNEYLTSKKSIFVTLTYNDEHLSYNETRQKKLNYKDIQLFLKRVRSSYKSAFRTDINFKYLVCGEYGSNYSRPHYHIILFIKDDIYLLPFYQLLVNSWHNGFVYPRLDRCKESDLLCTLNSIAYATKYVSKYDEFQKEFEVPEFIKWSKGLGKDYVLNNHNIFKQYRDKNRISYLNKAKNGEYKEYSVSLPIYYRKLVFSPAEQYIITEDYINSLQYNNQLSLMKDLHLYNHLRNLGVTYERKSFEKLQSRKLKTH